MNVRRAAGAYCVLVGILMLGWWAASLAGGAKQVPELVTAPIHLLFVLAAEFLTAFALIVSGVGLLMSRPWGFNAYLVASGLLLYTAVNTIGVFAQSGTPALAVLFLIFVALTVMFLVVMTRSAKRGG